MRQMALIVAALGLLGLSTGAAKAPEVVVTVTGAEKVADNVACRLFSGPKNFPNGAATAGQQSLPRQSGGESCRFQNLKPGTYALVVALLLPGQQDVTRDMFGRPKQPWGVSNNVRPAMRAPRFQEAAFQVTAGQVTRLTITLAR